MTRLATVLIATMVGSAGLGAGESVSSFPGAEGFGTRTPGGRRGTVLFVTNLADSGPGSLRAACDARGPRMILFRVGGVIDLDSPLRIREPFVTVAGQSAPGDGVCLRRHALIIETHDVVVRFLRARPGDLAGTETDAIAIGGESRNIVIDHCSASWSVDEALSPSGAIADVTVQWCMIAEALNRSVHRKGPHGYGSLVRAAGGVSLHHNLWAHNEGRNPRLGDNYGIPPFPVFDVRNNVIYDMGSASIAGDRLEANYVANHIRPGPSAPKLKGVFSPTPTSALRFYAADNFVEGMPEASRDPLLLFARIASEGRKLVEIVSGPFEAPPVRTTSAREAYEAVLAGSGAVLPVRDAVDARVVAQVRRGGGGLIDSQRQVGGWPEYRSGPVPIDSDNDGIPDEWEQSHGLDPRSRADSAWDRDGDGYTNLEEYLDSLVANRGR